MARRPGKIDHDHTVWVHQRAGASGPVLLDELLAACGFWSSVADRRGPVVIKPDLDCCEQAPHAGTEAALVEHLIDRLYEHGFTDVAVADVRNEEDAWLHNRDPQLVPELTGWRFRTPQGRSYEVFDAAGGARWREAALRIVFAKNRTHEEQHFALTVHNLASLAGTRRGTVEDALQVLREAPPHWCLIDAMTSAHGGAGQRAPRPLATHTLIASPLALLADWAGAARMGLDPYASAVNAAALHAFGLPPHRVQGPLAPYPLWRNVHPLMARSARQRQAAEGVGALAPAWFQTVDRERFAPRDFYSDRLNALITPLMARVDDNPRAFWIVVTLNLLLARLGGLVKAQHTLFAKDRLRRREAPLLMDPLAYPDTDYDAVPDAMAPYEALLAHLPPGRNGLRWRHVDGAIVFGNEHVVPVAYDKWVRRVDISRGIQYMNDYIGGATVAVRRDGRGRVRHQAERNLYLQQPNWMVLFGGEVIDVEKLQCIRRAPGRQSIYWRTVASPNDSALADDGCVEFTRTPEGQVRVRVAGRQHFRLPLPFQMLDINLAPALRDPIIEGAYTTFFEGTLANLQAAYEGRDFRIGHDPEAENPKRALPRLLATAAAALGELLRSRRGAGELGDALAWLMGTGASVVKEPAGPPSRTTDAQGFVHFSGQPAANDASGRDAAFAAGMAALARDAPDFLQGLADAVHRDLDQLARG
ncbi:hypothetical protein ACS5PK_18850 [Roseateles sp. DB2]|uniref:hypothetical protein n=1 Tax=Roseateles sp. DB2 TaxID=3453717 RepID=UPI003EED902F